MQRSQKAFNIPNVVVALVGVFVLVHAYRYFLSPAQDIGVLLRYAFIPLRIAEGFATSLPGGAGALVWSFVSYMFLHADWVHLLVNSVWMVVFGSVLARRFGATRFILFSLLCAAGGAALHLAARWGDVVPVIGASAAISGQMAGAVRFIFNPPGAINPMALPVRPSYGEPPTSLRAVFRNPQALIFLGVWFALNLLGGIGGVSVGGEDVQIAWEAHVGGFLSGLFLFSLFDPRPAGRSGRPR